MWKWVIVSLVFILFLTSGAYFSGFTKYIEARWVIYNLPSDKKNVIWDQYLGKDDPYLYSGILAGITTNYFPGIWVWGKGGLHYFKTDEYSVFSFFSGCKDEVLNSLNDNQKITIDRDIYSDLKEWRSRTKQGQYVVVMIARPENGGNLGNLREAKANDWWPFSPKEMKLQCKK